jgi:CheY-like chemotaxis protein
MVARWSAQSDGPGCGSEFIVRLPKAAALSVVTADVHRTASPCDSQRVASAPLEILVVDDNHDSAEMLAEALKANGHRARVAHDGPSALQLARGHCPAVAILDLGLPVMDGYELAARLRELPGLATIRLTALTGYGQESDRERTRAAGFHHHLVKPVDFQALAQVVSAPFEANNEPN